MISQPDPGVTPERLLDRLAVRYDAAGHHALLTRIWRDERWFDTPRQRAAAETVRAAMADAGLDGARVVPFAADGRTRFQDWTTKLAWSCDRARVAVDGEVLADRAAVPWAVAMGSGPLAETTAPIVDLDRCARVDADAVRGRFVLSAQPANAAKARVRGMGALGVLSDWIGNTNGVDADTTKWCNAWGDGPGEWYVHADEAPLAGFCLSPAAGGRLRALMAARPDLRVTASSDARAYAGESHCVTAVLPGRDPTREIWLYGHACEPGANDNTSGVATLVEVGRLLNAMIAAGDLPRPLCSIRLIATEECLGMLAFATAHPELRARALAGLNVDTVGDRTDDRRPHGVYYGPFANPSLAWPIVGVVGEAMAARLAGAWHLRMRYQVPSADDMISDPNCGVGTAWIGRGNDGLGYHSSADTPEVCEALPLRANALTVAASAYLMADLERAWSPALGDAMTGWLDRHVVPARGDDARALRRWAAATLLRDARRHGVAAPAIAPYADRYAPAGAPPLADLPTEGAVYRRRTWGTCTFETAPPGQRRFGCWSRSVNAVLYWTDGVRGTAAIDRLAAAEIDAAPDAPAADVLAACAAAGTAERVR